MIKRTIKETIREYDENYKLTRESITETAEDDTNYYGTPYIPITTPNTKPNPFWYASSTS